MSLPPQDSDPALSPPPAGFGAVPDGAAPLLCPGFRRISGPLLGMCLRCANFGADDGMPPAVAFRSGVPDCPSFTPL